MLAVYCEIEHILVSQGMSKHLMYLNLLSKDSERLIDFYSNVVGLKPLRPEENPATETWYGFDTGATPFAIEPMTNRNKYPEDFAYNKANPVLIQFRADSPEELAAWTERLEAGGVTIGQRLLQKSYGMISTFADPDGNLVELLYQNK